MNYKDLDIKRSYISFGDENITRAFLNPMLKHTKVYKRSVGFFSSGVIDTITDGIVALARNKGKIKLIASPELSDTDINAISIGYQKREEIIKESFARDFKNELNELDDIKLQLLVELIASNVLDIKIAVTDTVGIYHDKLGILEDFDGNKVVFYGSANSSKGGYKNNYEKIRVVKGWDFNDCEIITDEELEFDSLWDGSNPFVKVYNYQESAQRNILEIIESRKSANKSSKGVTLRDYQEKAINAWVCNNYHGFYVMATGTGKTWTAIYSAKELMQKKKGLIVICAPYKHLVKQWEDDVRIAFPDANIILVSSENSSWDKEITESIIKQRYDEHVQIIIISTIISFNLERFKNVIEKSKEDKLLIVDEAHRFTNRDEILKQQYKYMLGLSATPYSGSSAEKGRELMDFFGGQVFNLPIEEALNRKYLVQYYYNPIYVTATDEEENRFRYYTQKILSCFKNGILVNRDLLVKSMRSRLRVISMADEKLNNIDSILDKIENKDHVVVYCGDGRLFDDKGEEIRHIQAVKQVLSQHSYKASQFTAGENMSERMQLVDAFDKGEISALAAIRCLDEGINIPSIKSALILSSNDDYREFVQRRGRILRTYENKNHANIYDVIVLPSSDLSSWAKIELRRYYEYSKLALNSEELQPKLEKLLEEYNLQIEDIDVYDYENMEDEIND